MVICYGSPENQYSPKTFLHHCFLHLTITTYLHSLKLDIVLLNSQPLKSGSCHYTSYLPSTVNNLSKLFSGKKKKKITKEVLNCKFSSFSCSLSSLLCSTTHNLTLSWCSPNAFPILPLLIFPFFYLLPPKCKVILTLIPACLPHFSLINIIQSHGF